MIDLLMQIPDIGKYNNMKEISDGYSFDRKFKLNDKDNRTYLLRLTDIQYYDIKKQEYSNYVRIANKGIVIQQPIDFGICNDGKSVYMILSWIEGSDVMNFVKESTEQDNYEIGRKVGVVLRKLHDISPIESENDWYDVYGKTMEYYIDIYKKSGVDFKGSDLALNYIANHKHLLKNRQLVIRHGDFHWNNVILMPDKEIGIIDFDRCEAGDGWEDFGGTVWALEYSSAFAKGQIHGYFSDTIPKEFFPLYKLYISVAAFQHFAIALECQEEEFKSRKYNAERMVAMYGDYSSDLPDWYSILVATT